MASFKDLHTPLLGDEHCVTDDDAACFQQVMLSTNTSTTATIISPRTEESDEDSDLWHDDDKNGNKTVSLVLLFGRDAIFWMAMTFKLFLIIWVDLVHYQEKSHTAPIFVCVGIVLIMVTVWTCQLFDDDKNNSNSNNNKFKVMMIKSLALVLLPEIIMMIVLLFVLLDKIMIALSIFLLGLLLLSILGMNALVRHLFFGSSNIEFNDESKPLAMADAISNV